MSRITFFRICLLLSLCCVLSTTAFAQLPQTRLYALSRLGAQAGDEIELSILSGDDLEEVQQLHFSHPGITARQKTTGDNQTPVNNTFLVKVAENVPVGVYEVRAAGFFGVSNPRRFEVGHQPEVAETADNNTPDKANAIELGQTVNGRMESGNDVDWFRFVAKQGTKVILDCRGERLDSKLDASLAVYDASGRRRLAYSRNRVRTDPVLVFPVPADGEYLVKLHDQTYSNGNEFGYRLLTGTGPRIEFAIPPSGQAGTTQTVRLYGHNLPHGQPTEQSLDGVPLEVTEVQIEIPQTDRLEVENRVSAVGAGVDAFSYRLNTPQGVSNALRIGIASAPVVVEAEPNDVAAEAQRVTVPVEIGGQFAVRNDTDLFRFEAKAGEVLYVEVISERMGSTADPYVVVQQIKTKPDQTEEVKRLTAQDDDATVLEAKVFETSTDDAIARVQIPEDGLYEVVLRDRYWESRGDPTLNYTLSIQRETPDFRLVALPGAPTDGATWPIGLRRGDNFPVKVFAFRKDGFVGPITISAKDIPDGFTCSDVVMADKENSVLLVLTAGPEAAAGLHQFRIEGQAVIEPPAHIRSEEAAVKGLEAAQKPLPDLQKAVAQAQEKLNKAKGEAEAALQASNDKPDDAGLKQRATQLQQEFDKATLEHQQAMEKQQAVEQQIAAAQQAVEQARAKRAAETKTITRNGRAGTIVWSLNGNTPAISRITPSITFSVMEEVAPFELQTPLTHVTAHQSRQILLPVTLQKRNEFNEKVTFAAQGLPKNANIDIKADPIEKDQGEQLVRLFVKDNAPAGTYTFWLKSTGQVAYQRNPQKAERLKTAHEALQKQVAAANETVKQATEAKTAATNTLNAANQLVDQLKKELVQRNTELTAAKQQLNTAEQAIKQATTKHQAAVNQKAGVDKKLAMAAEQLAAADVKLKTAQAATQATETKVKETQTTLANAETALQSAMTAAAAATDDEALQQAVVTSTTARDTAKTEHESATKAHEMATKAQQEQEQVAAQLKSTRDQIQAEQATAQQAVVAAEQELKKAEMLQTDAALKQQTAEKVAAETTEKLTAATAAAKQAMDAKVAADQAERDAQNAAKSLEDQRKVAEKAATDAANAAKPKNVNFTPPTRPLVIEVKPAPVKLAVNGGGDLKRGNQVEVKVTVTRQNGFQGPVTLVLPEVPHVSGVTAEPVTINPDQNEGTLTIAANGEATEGALANLVIRADIAQSTDGAAAAVDVPVNIKITK